MMSGTQLVLLAMYSTVNVMGHHASNAVAANLPVLIGLLIAAAMMSLLLLKSTAMPERRVRKPTMGPPRLARRASGPAPRRV
jgi:hypothetical protein